MNTTFLAKKASPLRSTPAGGPGPLLSVLSLAIAFMMVGCDSADGSTCTESVATTARAIRLGDAGVTPADEVWRGFPLRLAIEGTVAGERSVRGCTAVRVSNTGILTAAHCFSHLDAGAGHVELSADGGPSPSSACASGGHFSLRDVSVHPVADAAFVRVADLSIGETATLLSFLPEPQAAVVLAGYGLTESGTTGALRAIAARVISAGADQIVVQGDGGGACVGDSGGPLLLPGQGRSAGVLSGGSASCEGKDEYVPTASLAAWLQTVEPSVGWNPS